MRALLRKIWGGSPPAMVRPASVPAGWRVYAIGDVHGECRCLRSLLAMIAEDAAGLQGVRPLLVFLGDYIDRGPDSRDVLELLRQVAAAQDDGGPACRFLLGNHEVAMLEFLRDPVAGAGWLNFGGAEALVSYGVRASVGVAGAERCRTMRDQLLERLPAAHLAFLKALEPMAVLGDYLFVHAGVRPGVELDRQTPDDLLWIREPFLSSRRDHGKVVVHGHSIVEQPLFLANRIGLDTGAYATGRLTALRLEGEERAILQTGN